MAIGEVFGEIVIVAFGYSLNDSMFGEFRVLNEVRSELTFGFHGEIKWNGDEAFELGGCFEEHC